MLRELVRHAHLKIQKLLLISFFELNLQILLHDIFQDLDFVPSHQLARLVVSVAVVLVAVVVEPLVLVSENVHGLDVVEFPELFADQVLEVDFRDVVVELLDDDPAVLELVEVVIEAFVEIHENQLLRDFLNFLAYWKF